MLGTTFSHRYIDYLKLDQTAALEKLFSLKLSLIRICCYWDEIEEVEGQYDFSRIKKILDYCEKAGQDVIVTVGMKAPRWPEFYLPKWTSFHDKNIQKRVLSFIEKTIQELKNYAYIRYWQVENEPLDPSGPNNDTITIPMLAEEIQLVKITDPKRKIIVNLWGNDLSKRNLLPVVSDISDIVGLDLYYRQPISRFFYRGPRDSDRHIKKLVNSAPKPVWVTELQAEPWENDVMVAKEKNPKSMSAELLKQNVERVKQIGFETILLWGFEYWLLKKLEGDESLWNAVKELSTSQM